MPDGMATDRDRVVRRRVFYIPGYDPFPPRRYRELYRKEGGEQARIGGYDLALSPRQGGDGFGWHAALAANGTRSEAEIEVLAWSDIVNASMGRSIAATYWQLLRTAWTYLGSGALFGLVRLRKGPTIAALYPIVLLVAEALAAILLGSGVALLSGWLLGGIDAGFRPAAAPLPWYRVLLPPLLGTGAAVALLRWCKRHDNRVFAYYLMHDYAFTAREGGAMPAELEPRLREFGDRIAAALSGDWDEVLVVGHSSGAHLAVPILARLIRDGQVPAGRPALAFLTLGQVVPMVSFLPKAAALRGDLAFLAASGELTWVDVSAPGDGCAYALCDPVSVSGVAPEAKRWPLVISAAFTRTLSPERWRALRWRFFRLHFQYLCAFDRPGDYDYFQITAGPLTLAARYRGRAPSHSRIERPLNPYRDIA